MKRQRTPFSAVLQKMHAEAQGRLQNATGRLDNGAANGSGKADSGANVARRKA
jgi:hypothetical protein